MVPATCRKPTMGEYPVATENLWAKIQLWTTKTADWQRWTSAARYRHGNMQANLCNVNNLDTFEQEL